MSTQLYFVKIEILVVRSLGIELTFFCRFLQDQIVKLFVLMFLPFYFFIYYPTKIFPSVSGAFVCRLTTPAVPVFKILVHPSKVLFPNLMLYVEDIQ